MTAVGERGRLMPDILSGACRVFEAWACGGYDYRSLPDVLQQIVVRVLERILLRVGRLGLVDPQPTQRIDRGRPGRTEARRRETGRYGRAARDGTSGTCN